MASIKEIKWPTVPFTHTELGEFNGVDRHDVWSLYQKAIKSGHIIPNGELRKSGKGKAAVVWIINPNPPPAGTVVEVTPKPVVEKVKKEKVVKPQPAIPVLEIKKPAQAPVVVEPVVTEPVVETPEPVVVIQTDERVENTEVVAHSKTADVDEVEDVCPVCKSKLFCIKDATGWMVWCGSAIDKCGSVENPFGHSTKTNRESAIKEAVTIIYQKWNFGKT